MQKIQIVDVMNFLAGKVTDPKRYQEIQEASQTDARVKRWFERCRQTAPGQAAPAEPPGGAAFEEGGTMEPAAPDPEPATEVVEKLKTLRDSLWVQLPGRAFPAPPEGEAAADRLVTTTLP